MHPKKLQNLINLSIQDRYDYFIREIVKNEVVWGLSTDDSWIRFVDHEGDEVFPIWPHKEVAEFSAFDDFDDIDWKSEEITLDRFMEFCIPDMIQEKVYLGIFYNKDKTGYAANPSELKEDILFEIGKYE